MASLDERPLRRANGRVLMLCTVVLAVGAAVTLALGVDDSRLLRLGIIAALWAALLGAFAAVRMRREVLVGAERAEELRMIYHLELEREVAARREHELTVERELREQVERRERVDIVALRDELSLMRETLANLLGGDVMVERVALRAESTRLLQLPDHPRTGDDAHGRTSAADPVARMPRSLTAAKSDSSHLRREPVDVPSRPAAETWFRDSDTRTGVSRSARPASDIPAASAAEPNRDIDSLDPSWRPAVPWAPSREPAASSAESPRYTGSAGSRRNTADRSSATSSGSAASSGSARSTGTTGGTGTLGSTLGSTGSARNTADAGGRRRRLEPEPGPGPLSGRDPELGFDQDPLGPGRDPLHREPDPAGQGPGRLRSGGRHGRSSESSRKPSSRESSDGESSSSYQTTRSTEYGSGSSGNSGGRRRASEPAQSGSSVGAHRGGRSVNDLLASFGESSAPRHRRRRAED